VKDNILPGLTLAIWWAWHS